jgi:chromate transporter
LPAVFFAFLRLGATAFGGPAMVAYIKDLAVQKRRWIDEASFQRGVALCQTIPGATAMQTAAYAGLQARGFSGALAAYAGFGLPAFILMLALTALYRHTEALPVTLVLFQGLRAVVVALIANAACNFAKTSIRSWPAAGLAGGAALALMIPISPILVIVGCAFVGVSLLPDAEKRTATLGASLNGHLLRATLTLVATAGAGIALLFWLDRLLFDLSVTMLQIDLVAFGGGFASVPLMQHEVVEARGWMTARTFMDGIALGQITPGPIVITATFAGYLVRGIAGAVVATLTVFLPSFVLVALIAPHFDRLQRLVVFRGATRGALVSFVGLLASVTVRFAFATSWTIETAILALVAFGALRLRIDVLWVVLGGVLLSVLAAR